MRLNISLEVTCVGMIVYPDLMLCTESIIRTQFYECEDTSIQHFVHSDVLMIDSTF